MAKRKNVISDFNKFSKVNELVFFEDDKPLTFSAGKYKKFLDLVQFQLRDVNGSEFYNKYFQMACSVGLEDLVELLLNIDDVDHSADDNEAFLLACKNGHKEVVKTLIDSDKIDPTEKNNAPIKEAHQRGHKEVVDLLLQNDKVKKELSDKEIKDLQNEESPFYNK